MIFAFSFCTAFCLPHLFCLVLNWFVLLIVKILHFSLKSSRSMGKDPGRCGSVDWALPCNAKGHPFDSWSEHMPGLRVCSLVGAHTRDNRSMFLSHISVSLPLSIPPFPSTSLSLKKKNSFLKKVYVNSRKYKK